MTARPASRFLAAGLAGVALALSASGASAGPPLLRTPSADGRAAGLYAESVALAASGQEEAAVKTLRRALKIAPRHRPSRLALAVLLARGGGREEALALLAEGRRLEPRQSSFTLLEARLCADGGDTERALALLDGLPEAPETQPVRALRAAIYQKGGRHDDAARIYGELLQQEPLQGLWWLGLGIARESQKRLPEALDAYRGALRSGGLDADSLAFVNTRVAALESAPER